MSAHVVTEKIVHGVAGPAVRRHLLAALERVGVVAASDLARQLVDLVGVSTAQHDVIRLQCGQQTLEDVIDSALPTPVTKNEAIAQPSDGASAEPTSPIARTTRPPT